jgi:GTPase involved in cell partitioning and DNA repair
VPVGTIVKEVTRTYDMAGSADDYDAPGEETDGSSSQGAAANRSSVDLNATRAVVSGAQGGGVWADRSALQVASEEEEALAKAKGRTAMGHGKAAALGGGVVRVGRAGIPYVESTHIIGDLDTHGQSVTVAKGGRGGTGNKGSLLTYSDQVKGAGARPHIRGEGSAWEGAALLSWAR